MVRCAQPGAACHSGDAYCEADVPQRPASPCRRLGCAGTVRPGAAACGQGHAVQKRTVDQRESASRRGYDARWRRIRLMHLRQHPLCANPDQLPAHIVPATDVDHIVPLADGGSSAPENLQSLCHSCHSRKTAVAQGRGRSNL